MNFLQRVGWLCLLVIAGSGPLPLWVHHTLHHTFEHAHAQGHCPSASHPHDTGCDHDSVFAKRTARAADKTGALSAADNHEDCATCYLLSQASTNHSFELTVSSQPLASLAGIVSDELPAAKLILAYCTRGPPVC